MPVESRDDLGSSFDEKVAKALREWAAGLGGRVALPSSPWRREGQHTGAVLVAIVLDAPNPPKGKMIVKVCPPGHHVEEAADHLLAVAESPPPFAARHLVEQLYPRYPVGDDRFLIFQGIAGDSLVDCQPVSHPELPAEALVAVCGQVARALLNEWNQANSNVRRGTVQAGTYLQAELAEALEAGRSARRWADAVGGLTPGTSWVITAEDHALGPMPNPYRLVAGDPVVDRRIDYLYGRSHGDLHTDNVLIPWQRPRRPQPAAFWLIDLAGYRSDAPLTRDPVALLLSVIAREMPPKPADQQALLDFVVTPHKQPPLSITRQGKAVWAVYEPGPRFAGRWLDEWRDQYLLSLLATALLYTSFENIGPDGRWWCFRLAARAGREFLTRRNVDPPPSTSPIYVQRPSANPLAVPLAVTAHDADPGPPASTERHDPPVAAAPTTNPGPPDAAAPPDPAAPSEPSDLSEVRDILSQLCPDPVCIDRLLRRLPTPMPALPTFEDVRDVWSAILQEASPMAVIRILDIVANEQEFAHRPDLVRAARRCQRRWRPDLETVRQLADSYHATLATAVLEQDRWTDDAEWIANTISLNQALRTLATGVETLLGSLASGQGQDHDDDPQALQDLLSESREMLDALREEETSPSRRQEFLEELQRLDEELAVQLDSLATLCR